MSKKEQKPDFSTYEVEKEKEKLFKAASGLGMTIPQSFYDNIGVGDIIEIYTLPPRVQQLYANEEFSRNCSYTAEQMSSIPFPDLFWREPEVNQQIFGRAAEVVKNRGEAQPWDLPDHELVESLHPRKRTFEMSMRWIAPCFKTESPDEVIGWTTSLRVNLIFEWDEDIT